MYLCIVHFFQNQFEIEVLTVAKISDPNSHFMTHRLSLKTKQFYSKKKKKILKKDFEKNLKFIMQFLVRTL